MIKELEDLLRLREQKVEIGSLKFVVRELTSAATLISAEEKDVHPDEASWRVFVRCVFDESGVPAFSDADIPKLKASSKWRLRPLVKAVNQVNGFEVEDEAKNSAAAPG